MPTKMAGRTSLLLRLDSESSVHEQSRWYVPGGGIGSRDSVEQRRAAIRWHGCWSRRLRPRRHLDLVKTHFQKQATACIATMARGNLTTSPRKPVLVRNGDSSVGDRPCRPGQRRLPGRLVVTGTVYPELERHYAKYPSHTPRILFRNNRNGSFVQMAVEAGAGVVAAHTSRGVSR